MFSFSESEIDRIYREKEEDNRVQEIIKEAEDMANRYGIKIRSNYLNLYRPTIQEAEELLDAVERAYRFGEEEV